MEGADEMRRQSFMLGAAIAVMATAAGAVSLAYRRDMRAIRDKVARGSRIARTSVGSIEYAEEGAGFPLLLIHGAGGGYDQGLMIGRDYGKGYRVVAPSRFGYLKTPLPEDASPAAQADAHAALLDWLNIDKALVVGISAGGPSAIELGLRHPARVQALLLIVPRAYDPSGSIGPDKSFESRLVFRAIEASADFLLWAMIKIARRSVVRFLGVLPEVEAAASAEDRARVTEVMESILPLSGRIQGIVAEGAVELSPWPLDRLTMPVLIISAEDDLFGTLPGARFTAAGIPGSELHVLESGGHLMVGQREHVNRWIADFLNRVGVGVGAPPRAVSEPAPIAQQEAAIA